MSEYIIGANGVFYSRDELYHHGIKGMKWGVRKAKAHTGYAAKARKSAEEQYDEQKETKQSSNNPNRAREIAIGVGAAAGTALAAYGVYKVATAMKNNSFKHSMDRGMKCAKNLAERGQFDIALSTINDAYSHYGESIGTVIKRTIANNEVRGKVDWRNVAKTLI